MKHLPFCTFRKDSEENMNDTIWFDTPTDVYTSGLPIGNGEIAAMVLGEAGNMRFALNHEVLWRVFERRREVPYRADRLAAIRERIAARDYERATQMTHEAFSHYGAGSARHNMPYVPAGDLFLTMDTGEVRNYSRRLDLRSGVCTVTFDGETCGHVEMVSFISLTDGMGVIRVRADNLSDLQFTLGRVQDENCRYEVMVEGIRASLFGVLDGELHFLIAAEGMLADPGTAVITFGIDVSEERESLSVSLDHSDFDGMLAAHKDEFARRLGSADITVDAPVPDITTDRRIAAFHEGGDPTFPLLFFHYGKYLMVAGSGKLPHNLQGKWNEEIAPPWQCDYHLDINLQMNYWFTDVLGMGYANEALFRWCEACLPYGREKAREQFGCRGICYNLSTDVWGSMFHDAYGWDPWIGAAPWLAQHFYRHYLYTGDVDFLRDRAYPFLVECCEFFEDYAVEYGGKLHITPSCSPENRFAEAGKLPISVCADCAMDISLYREVLTCAHEAAHVLGVDGDRWARLRDKLVDLKIGSDGRLLEWDDEYAECEPRHRHVSHLVGFYPGWDIPKGSAYAKACEKSLDYRLSFGGGQTGWSRAWVACLYARMGRAEDFFECIRNQITEQCSPSLLDFHPPTGSYKNRIFQIDGNFGGTAAICEALVSARYNEVTLLSACPDEWRRGSVSHFRLPYDTEISFDFEDGRITRLQLLSGVSHTVEMILPDRRETVSLEADVPWQM